MIRSNAVVSGAAWNLLGSAAPLASAVFAVPYLIFTLGPERFGLLGLVWVLIGYFNVFDLGVGRAITKLVAQRTGKPDEVQAICGTGMVLACAIGSAGALLVAACALAGLAGVVGAPPALQGEFTVSLLLVAAGIPVVVANSAYRGVLEGFLRFRLLNLIRTPAGVLLFLVPCALASVWPRLEAVTLGLVVTRVCVLAVHAIACREWMPLGLRAFGRAFSREWARVLVRFGGWLTVSNIVNPIILNVDRFVVGAVLSAGLLAYYVAPFEAVSRLLIFPAALTSALFPALARAMVSDQVLARQLQAQAMRLTLLGAGAIVLVGCVLAEPALRLWLSPEFAARGAMPMRILLVGLLFNALAQVPQTALYGLGHTRPVALLNLAELPCHLVVLHFATHAWGLEGAAFAWTVRNAVDYLALTWMEREWRGLAL